MAIRRGAPRLVLPVLLAAIVVASCSSTPSLAPGHTYAGTFISTGALVVPRQFQSATLLADGRVLIAGGWDQNGTTLSSAELYDPATGAFKATGSMASARAWHTATRLSDGRVLVAGGIANGPDGYVSLALAELYDPRSGNFSPTGSLITARDLPTATLLADGRVLVAGGQTFAVHTGTGALAAAELYDPKTGAFSATGSMAAARIGHSATLLPRGRVLIVGGSDSANKGLASAETYDSETGTFDPVHSMSMARAGHSATLLSDGRVLVTGGNAEPGGALDTLASAELYDPATGTFSATGSMTTPRIGQSATLLSDGRVLVAGGNFNGAVAESAELYDPGTGTFSLTGSMSVGRSGHTATKLLDGRVLIIGESDADLYQ